MEAIEMTLRDVGLYMDDVRVVPGERPTVVMRALVGDLAFSDRVQNPTQVGVDGAFDEIASMLGATLVEDARRDYTDGTFEL